MFVGIGVGVHRQRFAGSFATSYSSRVIADGGTIEALDCVAAASSLLQSASLLIIPSGYKAGVAYAELPSNGNGDLTWSRNSVANRTNASGLIQQVPWNLLQYSEDFSNAYWSKTGSSINANSTNAPNSTLTADSLIEDSSTGLHFTTATITVITNTTYTATIYVKANTRTKGRFRLNDTGGQPATDGNFDLSAGTISFGTIEDVGSGWYRLSLSRLMGSTSASLVVFLADSSGTISYTGNGTSGIFIWGAQLVEGTTAQTYLPTTDRLNFPRLSYMYGSCPSVLLEPQRTNSIRNSTMQGAVAGSPGTLPTNWNLPIFSGLTRTIVGTGIENGLPYIDLRFNGTATATGRQDVRFESATQITASNGQNWTNSVYIKTINIVNAPNSFSLVNYERDSSGNTLNANISTVILNSNLQRYVYTTTNILATVAFVQNAFAFSVTSGTAYDFTIRIAAPQMELGAYATTWINTTNAAATRVADSFSRNNIYTNGLISASGGTWFIEMLNNIAYTRDASSQGIGIGDSSTTIANGFLIVNTGTGRQVIQKIIASATTNLFTTTTDTIKIAIKWNGTSADVFVNGTKQVSATAFTTTLMEFLNGTGAGIPRWIKTMALYPTPLSDADCQTLTT